MVAGAAHSWPHGWSCYVICPTWGPSRGLVLERSVLERNFAATAGVVLLFLLVFGLVGGCFSPAGCRPLSASQTPHAWRDRLISHRIELEGRRDEFRELADSFDAMLARLEAHIAEQQRFAANASHELRTPLQTAGDHADTSRRCPQRSEPRHRQTRRPPPRRQHPSDRPHRSIAPAQPRRPTVAHPRTRRPVPRSGRSHPACSSPSQNNAASPSRPPATRPPPSAHTRSCCS